MKKTVSIILALLLVLSFFTGCGNKTTTSQVTNLRIAEWGTLEDASVDKKLVNDFNAAHKDINVTLEAVADGYGDKLLAGLASGQAPDVFLIGEGDFLTYISKKVVEPLNPFMSKDKKFDKNIYNKSLLDYGLYKDNYYYLTKDFNPLALWYNKKIFDDAGVKYPDESWTWNDLLEVSKKLTKDTNNDKNPDVYGFFATQWDYPLYTYLWSNGADISNADGSKAEGFLDSQKTIDAIQWYTDLMNKYNVSPTPAAAQTFGGDSAMFKTNRVGMMITGRWVKSDFDKAGIQYGSALIPKGADGKRAEVICAAGWAINAKSANKQASWELMKWMSGPEAQKERSAKGTVLPAIQTQLDEVKKTEEKDKAIIDMMQYAQKPVRMKGIGGQYFGDFFGKAMEKIFLKQASVKDALTDAAKQIDDKIAQEVK